MTEDEAKLKLCPLATNSDPEMGDMGWDKEISGIHPAFRCVASNCMMWRISVAKSKSYISGKELLAHGYCGLAGKP